MPEDHETTRMDEVMDWRHHFAIELGYHPDEAIKLALSNIDLHDVEKLLKAGCRHDLAARIAWPLQIRQHQSSA